MSYKPAEYKINFSNCISYCMIIVIITIFCLDSMQYNLFYGHDLSYLYLCAVMMPILSYIVELTVEFSSSIFDGIESTGIVSVTLLLRGGVSASDITVTVFPYDQSPVSAEGKSCCDTVCRYFVTNR